PSPSQVFAAFGSFRSAGPSHLWESRSFAPAALSTAAPSHLGESRSFAPAALRMTGSLASLGREGNHPPFLFPFPKPRGVVILRERAERARAKDLLSRRGPAKVCERRTCCHAECERGICSVEAREIDLVQLTQVGSISSVDSVEPVHELVCDVIAKLLIELLRKYRRDRHRSLHWWPVGNLALSKCSCVTTVLRAGTEDCMGLPRISARRGRRVKSPHPFDPLSLRERGNSVRPSFPLSAYAERGTGGEDRSATGDEDREGTASSRTVPNSWNDVPNSARS